MKTEYFIFNVIIVSLSTVSILLYKPAKFPNPKAAVIAIFSVILPYLVWDHLVTGWWWDFNSNYISGIKTFNLPIEEILFFITVPWSCLVIWVNLPLLFSSDLRIKIEPILILFGFMIALVAISQGWWYSAVVGLAITLFGLLCAFQQFWLSRVRSLIYLLVVVVLTILFNGYLTGRPVVTYNHQVMSTIKLGSVPIEDIGYGLVLAGSVAVLYEYFLRKYPAKLTGKGEKFEQPKQKVTPL